MTNAELEAFVRREFVEEDRPTWLWFYWRAPYRQLLSLLRETKSAQVRAKICEAFELRRTPSARPAMLAAMRDRSAKVRAAAVKAAVKLAQPEDGPALLAAFPANQTLESQYLLVVAFGVLGVREAIPLLTELLDELFLRDVAAVSLRQLNVPVEVPAHMTAAEIERFMADRRRLPYGERRLRREATTTMLIAILRSTASVYVRRNICGWFHFHPDRAAREALLERLFDDDARVREIAADAYKRVAKFGDGPIIMGAYRLERNDGARYELIGALGAAQHRAAIPLLMDHLLSGKYFMSAGWALSRLNGQDVIAAFAAIQASTTDRITLHWLAKWREEVEARMKQAEETQ